MPRRKYTVVRPTRPGEPRQVEVIERDVENERARDRDEAAHETTRIAQRIREEIARTERVLGNVPPARRSAWGQVEHNARLDALRDCLQIVTGVRS